jgi:outer membrane murein-binding lipoprotein Lpp
MVTGQAITSIEDEIRLAVSDAHIGIVYTALDWKRSEPSSVITRLERHIQRLPETLAATKAEAEAARSEAERAQSRLGAPWDRADELARLRRRQQEIDEQLAAFATGDAVVPPAEPPSTPAARSHDPAAPSSAAAPHGAFPGDPTTGTRDRTVRTVRSRLPNRPSSNPAAVETTARLDALQARRTDDGGISL